jgi:hypothetical protein
MSILYFIFIHVQCSCYVEDTLALAAAVRAGAIEVAGISRARYLKRLTWLKSLTKFGILFSRDERRKPAYSRIVNTLASLKLDNSNGTIRKQPYCVAIAGPPGCGKTAAAMMIASSFLKKRYGSFKAEDVVTLNETDEFHSEYRTSHKVVVFDDLGAERYTTTTENPWRKLIDFVNNVRKTALNPNVELKGNVYIEPDLVIFTTNLHSDFNVPAWMAVPSAIYRRIKTTIYMKSYDQVQVMNFVPTGARSEHCLNLTMQPIDGIKIIKEEKAWISMETLLSNEVERFTDHMTDQELHVQRVNSVFDDHEEPPTTWRCFLQDQIIPYLPRKIPLSKELERKLSYWTQFSRKFCVDDKTIALCQGGCQTFTRKEMQLIDKPREMFLNEYFNIRHFLYFKKEMYALGENSTDKPTFYITNYGFMEKSNKIHFTINISIQPVAEYGIRKESHSFSFEELSKMYEGLIKLNETKSFFTCLESDSIREKESLDSLEVSTLNTEEKMMTDLKVQIPLIVYEQPYKDPTKENLLLDSINVDKVEFHDYEVPKCNLLHMSIDVLKYVKVCSDTIQDMNGSGFLLPTASSLVCYTFLKQLWLNDSTCVPHFESELNGNEIDGTTEIEGTIIIVEAKMFRKPIRQTRKAMLSTMQMQPSIGVIISYTGYRIYASRTVPMNHKKMVQKACQLTFKFLEKYGSQIDSNIQSNKYKIHSKMCDSTEEL